MEVRSLPEDILKVATSELNEVTSRLPQDIKCIQEWASKQPHFNIAPNPQLIAAFLRGSKFSLEKCKEKIEAYYTLRTISPKYFYTAGQLPEGVIEIFRRSMAVKLPNFSNSLEPVRMLGRVRKEDADNVPLKDIIKLACMLTDMEFATNDAYVVMGQEVILDFKEVPYSYVGQFTPDLIKVVVVFWQEAYPLRLKRIHSINVPPVCYNVLATIQRILPKKLRSRLHFYDINDIESFYKAVPRSVLPEEYGGNGGTMKELASQLLTELENNQTMFDKYAQYHSDESKRSGKIKTADDFYGTDGSFRRLDID